MHHQGEERIVRLLERIHEALERIEERLEMLTRQTDLQRETLDVLLANMMELVDQGRTGAGEE
ncbi:MAG: hypothetical protein ACRELC_14070 [Gemmatimonadota bacterium]